MSLDGDRPPNVNRKINVAPGDRLIWNNYNCFVEVLEINVGPWDNVPPSTKMSILVKIIDGEHQGKQFFIPRIDFNTYYFEKV